MVYLEIEKRLNKSIFLLFAYIFVSGVLEMIEIHIAYSLELLVDLRF